MSITLTIVLELASRFAVIAAKAEVEMVIPDYVFAWPKLKIRKGDTGGSAYDGGSEAPQTAANKDLFKAPFKISIGPLSVEDFGFEFDIKTQRLAVFLGATFLMSSVSLALLRVGPGRKLGRSPKSKYHRSSDRRGQRQRR